MKLDACNSDGQDQPVTSFHILPDRLDALAWWADMLHEGHDDGFLSVDGASEYLSTTPKAIRRKVERGQIPHHRAGGRVLFNKAELRAWVERGG
jgi:excisionase family DNA binding protein